MDYKKYFEDFVKRIDKELEQKELYERKVEQLNKQHLELIKKLDKLICKLDNDGNTTFFMDNNQFINLMKISKRTAQQWRDSKTIRFSQIGSKIYYQLSDIKLLLDENLNNSIKSVQNHVRKR